MARRARYRREREREGDERQFIGAPSLLKRGFIHSVEGHLMKSASPPRNIEFEKDNVRGC